MPVLDLNKIKCYLSTQPVSKAWLFGSYARGEQTDASDVDIVAVFDDDVSLLGHIGIMMGLEKLLGKKVDLVTEGTFYPRVAEEVEKDKILIYERTIARPCPA